MENLIACLTGHRPKSLPWGYDEGKESCKKFKEDLKEVFINAIEFGVATFLTGMAEGFDMIGAEVLIELRKTYNHIKVIAVIPCKGQEIKWSEKEQIRYRKILEECDEKVVLSECYTPSCMMDRNKYMVNNSDIVIALYNGKPSGTGNTLKYAKEKGRKVKIINPEDYRN